MPESARESRGSLLELAFVAGAFALLLLILQYYRLESGALQRVARLCLPGFLVHHFLPARLRLPFFALLSIASIVLVLRVEQAAWVVGTGALLIALCHLRVPSGGRLLLFAGTAGLLAIARSGRGPIAAPSAVWPVLGSMFMFRLMVYLYDTHHERIPLKPWEAASYFFLLPNVCFPLFPVVDYLTFSRSREAADRLGVYQRGLQWIFRGVVQLLLYRAVYQYGALDAASITTLGDLFRHVVTTYLLYLRISGGFHLAIGMLHLFGFGLPETNHRYLLASSFTDFWRRINIYWKDFITKVFFYPIFFRLKRWGSLRAMVTATLAAFVITWALHSYQWFWLRGAFPVTWQDVFFWGALAVLVTANVIYEDKFGRRRSLRARRRSFRSSLRVALSAMGTFLVISLLWSLWSADSLGAWWSLFGMVRSVESGDVLLLAGVLGAIGLGAALYGGSARAWGAAAGQRPEETPRRRWLSPLVTGAMSAAILALAVPGIHSRFPARAEAVLISMRRADLNARDAALLQRGYYEELVNVGRFNPQLQELLSRRPADWKGLGESGLARLTHDYFKQDLIPGARVTWESVVHTVNPDGYRDRVYVRAKPKGTCRVVLLGASREMGWGVGDEDTYENLVEGRLNAAADGSRYQRYEILNLSVPGYEPVGKLHVLESRGLAWSPDGVFYAAHRRELDWIVAHLVSAVRADLELPYEFLGHYARLANIAPGMNEALARSRVAPHALALTDSVYRRIVTASRAAGAHPYWIFVPDAGEEWSASRNREDMMALAARSGFTVLDLSTAYRGMPREQLQLTDWDEHPTALAHRLLAEALYRELQRAGAAGTWPPP